MSDDFMAITEAGSIMHQKGDYKKAERVVADDKRFLRSIELGSTKEDGGGDVVIMLIDTDGHRAAYVLPGPALPDVLFLIQNYINHSPRFKGD